MCDKEKFEQLAEVIRQVKHDTGNIRTAQQGLGVAMEGVETHLKKLNSRTAKVESKVENLEDAEYRTVRCIQREPIDYIMHNMLTVSKFEEWEQKKEDEKERLEDKRMHDERVAIKVLETNQRRMQWIISAIVGVGMIAIGIINYLAQ